MKRCQFSQPIHKKCKDKQTSRIVVNKQKKVWLITDLTMSVDHRVKAKEGENWQKYQKF